MLLNLIIFFSLCLLSVQSFRLPVQQRAMHNFALYGSRHLGRYGSFVDTFQKPKNKQMDELYKNLEIPTSTDKSGAELRRDRERNLVKYKQENPYDVIRTPLKPLNFDQNTVNSVLKTLNMILNGRDKSQLSDAERVGVINWFAFEEIANTEIEDFQSNPKMREKLISWIKYHIRKDDIRFDLESSVWKWDNSRLRRHGKVVKTIVPRNR